MHRKALARDLSRAAAARDGRLALLPLPEPRRPLHAVALARRPRAAVASPGRRLRGDERHGALGGAADRAAHAELVRRGDVAARRQRRGQRDPRRGGDRRGLLLPAARPRGRSARRRGRRAGRRLDLEHDHDPRLPGARPARDTRRPPGAARAAHDRLHRGRRVRARGPRRARRVPLGPAAAGGRARGRRRPPPVSRQARRARLRRAAPCAT